MRSRHRYGHSNGAAMQDAMGVQPPGDALGRRLYGHDVRWVMRQYVPAPGAACTPARVACRTAQGPTPHPGRS
jgi:hypothetical protein